LRSDDVVFSSHRGHGHALAKGVPAEALFAELYGRSTGCSRGRGGSMHLFAPEVGLLGTTGIVGPNILQAAGAAYAFQLLGGERASVAFFGDGAVNNGAFHEGLNLASIWKLPVVFVCENNLYATEVAFEYASSSPDVASRAAAYRLPGIAVDGNDVLAVHRATEEALSRARAGGGASLIECRTYRTRPHAEGMSDFDYRTRQEVEDWKRRDPIEGLKRRLVRDHNWRPDEIDALEADVEREVLEADARARAAPWPAPATTCDHVFAEPRSEPSPPPPESDSRRLTFAQATLEGLAEEMERDPTIFVLGEGIGMRGGNFRTTKGLFERFGPERLRDTPICERGFVGLSAGAAMAGARPVVDFMFADFLLDAAGELIQQIAKIQYMSCGRLTMPVLLRGCIGIGNSAATHHSGSYYPIFAHFPGLRVAVPSSPRDAKGLLKSALRGDDPVIFLEHRSLLGLNGIVPAGDFRIEFGKAEVVRPGRDATVVAIALEVHHALEAAGELARQGIEIEVVDPRTVAPLDIDAIIASIAKTGRLLIVDETFAPCGIGAEIAAQVADRAFDELDAPIRRLNGAHVPTPYSPPLEKAVVPGPSSIVRAIQDLLEE
jgi:2-oxoisovalerate dehydrogenase E1 component